MPQMLTTVEEGVQTLFVLGKRESVPFHYEGADRSRYYDTLETGGKTIPLLKWRYDPRLYTLRDHFMNATLSQLGRPSTVKSTDFAPKTETMAQLLCREFDLAEFFVGSPIVSVMGYGDDRAANFVCHLQNGVLFNLEAAVTLPADARREGKHTLFTDNGMITDLAADKMLTTDQIHLFADGEAPRSYTDFDVNLFGLTLEQQNICYACYGLMTGMEDPDAWIAQGTHIAALVDAALAVLRTGKKFKV